MRCTAVITKNHVEFFELATLLRRSSSAALEPAIIPLPLMQHDAVASGGRWFSEPAKGWLARPSALKGLNMSAQGKFRPWSRRAGARVIFLTDLLQTSLT